MSLLNKYPELEALSLFIHPEKGIYKQKERFPKELSSDVLFVFGIFKPGKDFIQLLKTSPSLDVVFLCESLPELLSFIAAKLDSHFDDDRVHVLWKEEGLSDEEFAEVIAAKFPFEGAHFLQNGMDDERFDRMKKTFLRKIVLESAVHKELINYPKLCENLFANVYKLEGAFDIGKWKGAFKDRPAVITGAGPSLSSQKENLLNLKDKALILAGGSTITALDQMGVTPHLQFAIDPNHEEYERLRYNHQLAPPLIYGNRLQKDVFRFFPGSRGYIRTDTGGLFENYMDETLGIRDHKILEGLSSEALSVTSISLMTAIHLGCNPIYFAGVDLGYKKGARYSGNILSSWESSVYFDSMQQVKWMMEKDVIDDVVKNHPEISFFDATGDGTTFKKMKVKKLSDAQFSPAYSIEGKIENLILDSKFPISKKATKAFMEGVKSDLKELLILIDRYLEGELVYSLFSFEVEENKAFDIFFKGMVYALSVPLAKKLRVEKRSVSEEDLTKSIFTKIRKEASKLASLI